MPWTDNSDPGGRPGPKPGPKSGGKPGHHGPWGAPTPSNDPGEPAAAPSPRRPRGEGPKRGAPPPEDLLALLRRLRRRMDQELAALAPHLGRRVIPILMLLAVAVWALSGVYQVPDGQTAVVLRFGAFDGTAGPGWRYHLPTPIEAAHLLPTTTVVQTNVGGAGPPKNSLMLTGDGDIVSLAFGVQWRIADPAKYLFNIGDGDETVRAVGESVMRQLIGRTKAGDLQGAAKAKIEADAASAIQAALDGYGAGVRIVSVQMQTVDPPAAVLSDSQSPQNAEQDAQTAINQGNAYAARAVDDAKTAAAEKTRGAQAYSAQTIQAARAEADAFNAELAQYQRDPAYTRERLYLDTMQRILARSKTVVVDARGTNAPLVLPADSGAHPQPPEPKP